jgi:hypothetical protein
MKKVLTKYLALCSLALLMLPACKKNEAIVTSNGGKAGALNATTTTPVLNKSKLNDTTSVIQFNFTSPNYGYSAAVTNTLQIDAAGDNWKNPASATLGTKVYSQSYSTAVFNNLVLKLNLPAGSASQVMVRVMHTISASVAPIYSNVLTLTVTPFNLTSWVYVPGAYEGWANPGPQEDSLVSITGNGIYVGIINFTTGNNQFLITPTKGWANKYATTQSASTSGTSANYIVTYNGSNNFYAPSAPGQYLVTLDLNANTLTIVPADFYSIIGDAAQGWSTDVPMKYINDGNQSWVANLPLVSTGSFKIRQNDDWTYSWGVPKAGSVGDGIAGALNNTSNNNIPVATSGTYTVTFGMPANVYNLSSAPSILATYSIK